MQGSDKGWRSTSGAGGGSLLSSQAARTPGYY
jgi:hypothetical protein